MERMRRTSEQTARSLAHHEQQRLATVLQDLGGDGQAIDSGWMACDGYGSWANYAAGVGLAGPVSMASLEELIEFYRIRGHSARIHLTPYQHPSLSRGLNTLGFQAIDHDVVLLHRLDDIPMSDPSGLHFREVHPDSPSDVEAFCQSQACGHLEDTPPTPKFTAITKRVTQSAVVSCWVIELDGIIVGSGGLEVHGQRGVMIAACTHPGSRGLGIQAAFMTFRMQQAESRGIHQLAVASVPGGPTERNARRLGFVPAYSFKTMELASASQ